MSNILADVALPEILGYKRHDFEEGLKRTWRRCDDGGGGGNGVTRKADALARRTAGDAATVIEISPSIDRHRPERHG